MMDGWNHGGMNGAGAWMMVLVTVLLVAVVVVAVLVARGPAPAPPTSSDAPALSAHSAARELLDLRLARGEITAEEYADLRAVLTG